MAHIFLRLLIYFFTITFMLLSLINLLVNLLLYGRARISLDLGVYHEYLVEIPLMILSIYILSHDLVKGVRRDEHVLS